jgi:hypothetical protein
MAVVVLDQVELREVHPQVVEQIAILQQQTEAAVDHSQGRIVDLDLQVQMVL